MRPVCVCPDQDRRRPNRSEKSPTPKNKRASPKKSVRKNRLTQKKKFLQLTALQQELETLTKLQVLHLITPIVLQRHIRSQDITSVDWNCDH